MRNTVRVCALALALGGAARSAFAQGTDSSSANGRALPSPIQSGPFPSGDWLGSPIIGEPASPPVHPLMNAIHDNSRIWIYGWLDPSINFSTSKHSNIPLSYDVVPNMPELDQAVLRIERPLNTVQTDHVDWGFRLTNLYGIDYRFTTGKGWFSDQLLRHNNEYGYDPVEAYGLLYIPSVAQGMVIKVGRYISPPDIEAQMAPDNYLFTHSIMFTFDPYTFTGIQTTVRLDPHWQLQFGIHAGNDMAPWQSSAAPNGQLLVRWVSSDNNDSFLGGINSIGDGEFRHEHDNLQMIGGTWGHRFSDRFHMMTEWYYMWQFNAAAGGSCVDAGNHTFAFGGGCGSIIPGRSDAIGLVNYFQTYLGPNDYLSFRNDYLNDPEGQRSGFRTAYTSHTLGFIHYFTPWLSTRPELRFEHAWMHGQTPYDLGTKQNQFTFGADVIIRY